jgi:hypothetical protein
MHRQGTIAPATAPRLARLRGPQVDSPAALVLAICQHAPDFNFGRVDQETR